MGARATLIKETDSLKIARDLSVGSGGAQGRKKIRHREAGSPPVENKESVVDERVVYHREAGSPPLGNGQSVFDDRVVSHPEAGSLALGNGESIFDKQVVGHPEAGSPALGNEASVFDDRVVYYREAGSPALENRGSIFDERGALNQEAGSPAEATRRLDARTRGATKTATAGLPADSGHSCVLKWVVTRKSRDECWGARHAIGWWPVGDPARGSDAGHPPRRHRWSDSIGDAWW